jgi:hypothetical protein
MTITLEAIYDGEVLRPITFEATGAKEKETRSFLQTARSLDLEGPPDWSEKFEALLR